MEPTLLITITGQSQSGKTRLAHRIAAMLRENDIPREVSVIDPRHSMDDEDQPPLFPARLRTPVEIHVGEPFPPVSLG
ncbi:MAG: hypothetical protein EOP85_05065 [Verrucomicrobiaceae bacterium]|nr:MAG: hypothetical protein EOP85_05065 [Verrucomicrobiaceae bacterium]